jgi:hypothetical protein
MKLVRNCTLLLLYFVKIFAVIGSVLIQEQDARPTEFQPLPYHRMFIFLLQDLLAAESNLEAVSPQLIQIFAQTLTIVRPTKAPSFAFAWLEVLAHRSVIHSFLVRPMTKVSQFFLFDSSQIIHSSFFFCRHCSKVAGINIINCWCTPSSSSRHFCAWVIVAALSRISIER